MSESARIIPLDEIDSTNLEARRRLEAGEAPPFWVTARRQTAGRGRRGRAWDTSDGNLAATAMLVTDRPPIEAAQIAFVAALAVHDLMSAYVGSDLARLKWPNDTLLAGRKVSGVLVESGAYANGRIWLVVGIGVNLAHAPTGLERPATSLAAHMTGPPPTPLEAMHRLSEAFDVWRRVWDQEGFSAIAAAWTQRAHGLGARCQARLPNETVEGIAEGLDADGALRLRLDGGALRRITAGDVFF